MTLCVCEAELEQQVVAHKEVQQLLMSENEALQQQITKLRHDLVRVSHSLSLTKLTLVIVVLVTVK